MKLVQAYKTEELASNIEEWGVKNGISDLTLQHIMTAPKNPDAKVSTTGTPPNRNGFVTEMVTKFRDGCKV